MAEHEKPENPGENQNTRAMPQAGGTGEEGDKGRAARRGPSIDWRAVKDQFVSVLAAVVRVVGLIFAAVLVLHIIFEVAEANPDNTIVEFISGLAPSLTLGFEDLFVFEDQNLAVLVNFGIAAIFWLVISSVGSTLIRRIGGASA